jgi:hypothetical protein
MRTTALLPLAFKPDARDAQDRLRAYWNGEIVDRACVSVVAPKDGATPVKHGWTVTDFDLVGAIDSFEQWAEQMFFGGESMPSFLPNYGPGQWAGFFGGEFTLAPESDTSWAEPLLSDWGDPFSWTIDPENRWWKAILDLTRLAAERGPGKFIVSALDTLANVDLLSLLRGPSQLCLDLIENPAQVLHALRQVDKLYQPMYDAIYEAGGMERSGTTSWLDMWSDGRTQALQSDFCYMISPEHFRKFVVPSLEQEISCVDHAVYHMDGRGQIPHLNDLLSLPRLHTIQWVPGAGQPPTPAWMELLRTIQKAGKSVQLIVTVDDVKAIYRQLPPEKTHYWVQDCPSESVARELIDWMVRNT